MKTPSSGKKTAATDDAKLIDDLQRLSRSVDDDFTCRLSKVVTRKYAQVLIYSEADSLTGENLKKMKVFSSMAQDVARMRRGDTAHRRAQIEETRVQNGHQRTEEELLEQFKQWAENPEVRRCFILAPMEQMRRLRIIYGIPPTKDDLLLQRIVEADPRFGKFEPAPGQIKLKPNSLPSHLAAVKEGGDWQAQGLPRRSEAETDGREPIYEDLTDASDLQPPKITSDKTTVQIMAEIEEYANLVSLRKNSPPSTRSSGRESALNKIENATVPHDADSLPTSVLSVLSVASVPSAPQHSTPPPLNHLQKPPLSDYEKALLEGKSWLEAHYAQFTPAPEEVERRKRENEALRRASTFSPNQVPVFYDRRFYGPCPSPNGWQGSHYPDPWKVQTS
jgi:hypothetical protein